MKQLPEADSSPFSYVQPGAPLPGAALPHNFSRLMSASPALTVTCHLPTIW